MASWVGIDVSKSTLDCGWFQGTEKFHVKVSNDTKGFRLFLRAVPRQSRFVMEATGGYYLDCALFLQARGRHVAVENPMRIKRHMQADLSRLKTDKSDAFAIARFGTEKQPSPWLGLSRDHAEMQQLQALQDKLAQQIMQLKNQRHAFSCSSLASFAALEALQRTLTLLQAEKEKVELVLGRCAQNAFGRELALITSIPGIGLPTAIRLCIVVRDFSRFSCVKKLVSFLGLSPTCRQSGTSLHVRGGISHMGDAHMRGALYFCALSAARYNGPCRDLYQRLHARHKPGKVIVVAIMRKLLCQAYALVRKNQMFNVDYLID